MPTSTPLTLTRTLAELANVSGPTRKAWVRVQRLDGTWIEGQLLGVESTELAITDSATGASVHVAASDLASLSVRENRREREWMLAGVAIVGATLALVGYATLPWVRPGEGDIKTGFTALYTAGGALLSVLLARTGLRAWLTEWRPLYPPTD
jgi:hypothetical protein